MNLLGVTMRRKSSLIFSRNDLREGIKVPTTLTGQVAYIIGIQIGDGFLKKIVRDNKIDYLICYDGHNVNDYELYNHVVRDLMKKLFNKEVKLRKTTKGTIKIYFRSKAIFTFLNRFCGIAQSPKNNISVPSIIKQANKNIQRAFLSGLADTDFSLVFKKRKKEAYPVLDFQTSSRPLHESVCYLLRSLGFNIHSGFRERYRKSSLLQSYYINISGRTQLNKWMKEIGFKSTNHLTRYTLWKKLGHLPRGTNLIERYNLLK